MLGRIETSVRKFRRLFSRGEWLARALKLPVSKPTESTNGLVIIQIDGLSHLELGRAVAKGEMPFLNRIQQREQYQLYPLYSGVPATTPAVHAELFYGVQGAVPGFSFVEQESGDIVHMFEPAITGKIERELLESGQTPLLKDGSCYVSMFSGGAREPHFCSSQMGWGSALRHANPLALALFFITNIWSFVRIAALLCVEFVLAIADVIRGVIRGQDLLKELKFIPARIGVVVLLRELSVIGAKIDIARGMPVIFVNFVGYDEQAHRRGPDSRFAHWTLMGIDDAIARIWRAAGNARLLHYDVWVYSDHGQVHATPYTSLHGGRIFAEVLSESLARRENKPVPFRSDGQSQVELKRMLLLGGRWLKKLINGEAQSAEDDVPLTVAALGPLALIYYPNSTLDKAAIAQLIVEETHVPLVLYRAGNGTVKGWAVEGPITLPADGSKLLGESHPFMREVTEDLINLCHHPNAGDFIACGWRTGEDAAITFAVENGSHGGFSPLETTPFALLPKDIWPLGNRGSHRPVDLREAALRFLEHGHRKTPTKPVTSPEKPVNTASKETLTVMTYNVHRCIGVDGKLSPERIARVIGRHSPDIVVLQELDVNRMYTSGVDQAHQIAHYLDMEFHFHPAIHLEEEQYGDAILSCLPMRKVKAGLLPGTERNPRREPRGAIWVEVEHNGAAVQVINTHLGLSRLERLAQIQTLLGPQWLGHPECQGPRILAGDFNASPKSKVCALIGEQLKDVQAGLLDKPKNTFSGRLPHFRIDHIFVDPDIQVLDVEVPRTELEKVSSDHLPLIAKMKLKT